MQNLSFTCMHCETQLNAPPEFAGKVVKCPKCRDKTLVPGEEDAGGAYALAGEPAPSRNPTAPNARRSADIWRATGYEQLSAKSKSRLAEAQSLAMRGEWERAAARLSGLFRDNAQGQMTAESAVFRKPLSHCLTQWAERVLDGLEDDPDYVLSKPLRRLLEVAAEKQKWGGVFDAFSCGVCYERIASIAGLPFVRTTVGTAYMCCAKPTKNDQQTVAEVNVIWKRLSLATVLDDQNQDAWDAMKKLPAWQAMLRVEKFSLGRGNLWVRWDEATDGMLSDLVDAALEKAIEEAIDGMGDGFDEP